MRALLVVDECGSLVQASTVLGRTPSAVSLHMKRLQDALGAKLLRKQGRSSVLTRQGRLAAVHARRILQANEDLFETLKVRRPEV